MFPGYRPSNDEREDRWLLDDSRVFAVLLKAAARIEAALHSPGGRSGGSAIIFFAISAIEAAEILWSRLSGAWAVETGPGLREDYSMIGSSASAAPAEF